MKNPEANFWIFLFLELKFNLEIWGAGGVGGVKTYLRVLEYKGLFRGYASNLHRLDKAVGMWLGTHDIV